MATVPYRARVATIAWLALAPVGVSGRQPIESGQRLRISYDCGFTCRQAVGTVVALANDSITLATDGAMERLSLAGVLQVERSRGVGSRLARGAAIGALVGTGLVFGTLVAAGNESSSTSPCDPVNNQDAIGGMGTCLGIAALLGGLPGGLLGAFIGSRIEVERWEDLPLNSLRVGVASRGRRVGLAVRLEP